MTYEETITYLYNSTPVFQNQGKEAYKEGLENTLLLDEHFAHPHQGYPTIHIAGTNGKGSCAHTLAAILQAKGMRVGLYTSPHLIDFRERIRINGEPISKERVIDFVAKERQFFEPLHPSFFELTTALAFSWFKEEKVDIAVIEVGLGGRLDCTNIIKPILSIITNISFDHTQFLGNTLSQIASEKAGIIKVDIPICIGETTSETKPVFEKKALEMNAPITFAEDEPYVKDSEYNPENGGRIYKTSNLGELKGTLGGLYQEKNTNTILHAVAILNEQGMNISDLDIRKGFANVNELTGLMGRWQILEKNPTVICDTGHNPGGFVYLSQQLTALEYHNLHIVMGMVDDKDVKSILKTLPKNAIYYFTQANIKRALNADVLKQMADNENLNGKSFKSVQEAFIQAKCNSAKNDLIYVGGSTYIVAELLFFKKNTP